MRAVLGVVLFSACCLATACKSEQPAPAAVDPELAKFIAGIRAVDNHTHVGSTAKDDHDFDALPLDAIPPFDVPARIRPENPEWVAAYRALYGYRYDDLAEAHLTELRGERQRTISAQGENFPTWVLDKAGTEVMLANRIALGPGLAPPRFRWVSYVDALLLPLSTKAEAQATPDRAKLYPLEDDLLHRYLADLNLSKLPPTLDEYLRQVVTPTLERQRAAGCVAVKFEAAYLRSLEFAKAQETEAAAVYSRYVNGGIPPHDAYKTLEDFLFRYIAREAGRLGMAVHIHSFEGGGGFYAVNESDPFLLESAFNDPDLRKTNFVIIHGGGIFSAHAAAMLWKPNVYADFSLMVLVYPTPQVAAVLHDWLAQFPEKILFGTDAGPLNPDQQWDIATLSGTNTARTALGMALTTMMNNGEVTRRRAEEIATAVMRGNASRLYGLKLN